MALSFFGYVKVNQHTHSVIVDNATSHTRSLTCHAQVGTSISWTSPNWSKPEPTCTRRAVGAIIVNDEHQILGSGYNGAQAGVTHCEDMPDGCLRAAQNIPSGQRHEICRGIHAEQNAVIQAGAERTHVLPCIPPRSRAASAQKSSSMRDQTHLLLGCLCRPPQRTHVHRSWD